MSTLSPWRIVPNVALVLLALALSTGCSFAQGGTNCAAAIPTTDVPPQPSAAVDARVLPSNLPTTFELPVWKTITIGELAGVNAIRAAIDGAPCPIRLGDWADEILGRPAFPFRHSKIDLDLVIVSVAQLGFDEKGAALGEVYARALAHGLELCPPEAGPILRLNYLNQSVGEFLHIAMQPVARYTGELVDFTLGNGGAGLLLIGGDARPEVIVPSSSRFVFVKPRAGTVVASGRR
jgi:hypothetical protein